MSEQERYLIVKPSSLGDVIHAFPAVSLLAKHRPEAKIDWVVVPAFAEIVRMHPNINRIIPFPRKELGQFATFPSAARSMIHRLRKNHYTAVIDLQGLMRSAAISRLARADSAVGPEHPREGLSAVLYKEKLDSGPATMHAVLRNCHLVSELLGIPFDGKPEFHFNRNMEASAKAAAAMGNLPKGRIVAIAPGARWPSKCWPADFFLRTANLLSKKIPDCTFLLLGSKSEFAIASAIASGIVAPCVNLAGKTGIAELIEAIRFSKALLCNDSGPMHIAAALGVPVTAVFGPTDPVRTGPFSDRAEVLLPEGLNCLKCFRYSCDDPVCHRSVSPERAAESLARFLKESDK